MSKLFADVYGFNLTDKNLCIFWNINACELSDCVSLLTNNLSVKSTVDDDCLSNLVELVALEEVAASVCELLLNSVINTLKNSYTLLRSTNHTIIKCL